MQFKDWEDGEYRIHMGSLEPRAGLGHLAAVIVSRLPDRQLEGREIYRNLEILSGFRWRTSEQALQQALVVGSRAVTADREQGLRPAVRTATPLLKGMSTPWARLT